jgi:hypothetical protein
MSDYSLIFTGSIYTCVKKFILCRELDKVIMYCGLILKFPRHALKSGYSWDLNVGRLLFVEDHPAPLALLHRPELDLGGRRNF